MISIYISFFLSTAFHLFLLLFDYVFLSYISFITLFIFNLNISALTFWAHYWLSHPPSKGDFTVKSEFTIVKMNFFNCSMSENWGKNRVNTTKKIYKNYDSCIKITLLAILAKFMKINSSNFSVFSFLFDFKRYS